MQWMIHGAKNDEDEEWFLCFGASLGPVFPIYVPTSQILFNWLPKRREWLFFVCLKVRLIIFNYGKNQYDLIRTKLIWFSILIGFCERSPWKIWCAFLTYSNSHEARLRFFISVSLFLSVPMRDLWMLTIASCPHLDFVTMFGFLFFFFCFVIALFGSWQLAHRMEIASNK